MAIYPKAIWKGPAPASNYSPYSQNPGPKICFVTHVIVGSAQSAIGEFLTPGKQLSAHFVVDFDGTIYQILDTNDCAYAQAAGNYPPIAGIAIEFAGTPDVPMTDAQLLSGAAIIAWGAPLHNIPIVGEVPHGTPGVTSHCNPDGTPDPAWGDHPCPGPIRLNQIAGMVYIAYLVDHPAPPAPPVPPAPKVSNNMATEVPTGGQIAVRPDGSVFNYNGSRFYGSLPGAKIVKNNIIGIAPTKTGNGYWLASADGGVYAFGDAKYHGSGLANPGWGIGTPTNPVVGIVTDNTRANGYILFADSGKGIPTEYACNETTSYK